ncbi:polyprenyl synthetase family protein [Streptomyces wedmorensis]|uniref:polyprenyl synthetase family protein n=1 Tax=Streptomyces wedmorensis TaxID=43759 RepID=UPI0037903CC3
MVDGIGSAWSGLATWEPQVSAGIDKVLADTCPPGSRLHRATVQILKSAQACQGPDSNRFLPLAVLGAISGDPAPAVPVAVLSTIWFAGAEAIDDLTDAALSDSQARALTPHELMTAGITCLTVIPVAATSRFGLPESVAAQWREELTSSSLRSAEGQIADTTRDTDALTWSRVMRTYDAKTGTAYGRDCVMAASLAMDVADPEALTAWRTLGRLLGVLRQVHNDNAPVQPEQNEDLVNGTPTLLLAHALSNPDLTQQARLHELRRAALHDPAARAHLHQHLWTPSVQSGYVRRLGAVHQRAVTLLEGLAAPSAYRDAIRSRIDVSIACAVALPADVVR